MTREQAIKKIYSENPDSIFILCNGLTSREAIHFHPNKNSFYLLHAMGEALSVALGIASVKKNKNIVVIEGDGNSLMGMSSWSMNEFSNIKLKILQNGLYATTGNQKIPTLKLVPDWAEIIEINDLQVQTPNPPPPSKIIKQFTNFLNENI